MAPGPWRLERNDASPELHMVKINKKRENKSNQVNFWVLPGTDPAQWLICLTPLGILWTPSQVYATQPWESRSVQSRVREELGGHPDQDWSCYRDKMETRKGQIEWLRYHRVSWQSRIFNSDIWRPESWTFSRSSSGSGKWIGFGGLLHNVKIWILPC